jgi:hypothetical protein
VHKHVCAHARTYMRIRRYTALYSAVSMNNSLALGMFMIAIYANNIGLTGVIYPCVCML